MFTTVFNYDSFSVKRLPIVWLWRYF